MAIDDSSTNNGAYPETGMIQTVPHVREKTSSYGSVSVTQTEISLGNIQSVLKHGVDEKILYLLPQICSTEKSNIRRKIRHPFFILDSGVQFTWYLIIHNVSPKKNDLRLISRRFLIQRQSTSLLDMIYCIFYIGSYSYFLYIYNQMNKSMHVDDDLPYDSHTPSQ